ncbi:transposase, partial [Acinetobacter baumannii]
MLLANDNNGLPPLMRDLVQRLLSHLLSLDRQTQEIDRQIKQFARQSSACRTLEQIPGIGPITATALVATVGDSMGEFRNGRQLAA